MNVTTDNHDLFPYQKEGAEFLSKKRLALLADEMGLGKSAQAIVAADAVNARRVCVLCPAVARTNWLREFEKFSRVPRLFKLVFSKSFKAERSDSIICSYDLASHFTPDHFGHFDVLILDEAHYLKSIKTKRTQKVFGREGYVRHAKKIWALSGTPSPNHAGELWPLLYTFGFVSEPFERFVEKYCTWIDTSYGRQITGTRKDTTPELKSILKRVMLRRKTQDVLKDLPQLFFQDLFVDPLADQIDINFVTDPRFIKERELLERTFGHLDMSSQEALDVLEGLAGSVATLRRYVGLKKVGPVCELIHEELSNNEYQKIVIFAHHAQVVDSIKQKLSAFHPVVISGSTPHLQRQQAIDSFQKDPKVRVFIGNIQAAGTAITLTAANQAIFVEQDWVPGNNAQAAKRLHRIGQSKPVFIRVASLAGSFDEQVSKILMRKTRELESIFDKEKPLTVFQEINSVGGSNENT